MMKKLGLIIAVCLMTMVSASCVAMDMVGGTSGSWRYKVTVVVETPEGIKTGSAVREVHSRLNPMHLPEEAPMPTEMVAGEAVVVDLGKRGVLFAVTQGVDDYYMVFKAFPFKEIASPEGMEYYTHLKNAKAILPPDQYPQFVHFKDITDPKTVEGARDGVSCPNVNVPECATIPAGYGVALPTLYKAFGDGVKLKEVTIEMTDESVTREVDKWLSWLQIRRKNHVAGSLGGDPSKPFIDPTGLYLTGVEFKQGE